LKKEPFGPSRFIIPKEFQMAFAMLCYPKAKTFQVFKNEFDEG